MNSQRTKTRPRFLLYARPAAWAIGLPLLLVMLAGCLTTYAAGPPDQVPSTSLDAALPISADIQADAPTRTPGITLVPNMAVRAYQTTPTDTPTPEPTATETPTATSTPTDTPESTDTPTPTNTPLPTNTPRPTSVPPTPAPFRAYAWVDNYFPKPGSVVTVFGRLLRDGRPVNAAQMGVTWSYTHRKAYCTAYTSIEGRAACSQNIGYPLQNYWVFLDVVFVYEDQLYYAKTGFLTDP